MKKILKKSFGKLPYRIVSTSITLIINLMLISIIAKPIFQNDLSTIVLVTAIVAVASILLPYIDIPSYYSKQDYNLIRLSQNIVLVELIIVLMPILIPIIVIIIVLLIIVLILQNLTKYWFL